MSEETSDVTVAPSTDSVRAPATGSQTESIEASTPASRAGAASLVVALGILLSRIAGLVRDRVFAHYLGNSEAAGAFKAALRIPNFLQNLFGEGVLSASFIPVYSKLASKTGDEDLARRVAGVVGTVLALVVSVLVLLGVSLTPFFVDVVAPGFRGTTRELTIQLVRILFPGVGLLVLSAWCLGILNSHRKFFVSYVAPVLWNLAMIATLVLYGSIRSQDELVVSLAWGSVVGSFLQLMIQVPFVWKSAGRIVFGLDLKLAAVRDVFKNIGPVFIGRGVVQVSAYLDSIVASFLGATAVASLAYAQTIYLLPISLFGMSVAAAELPSMSVAAGDDAEANRKLRDRLVSGCRRIAFFVVPSAVAFLLIGRSVVAALYQTGAFGPEDTLYVWYVLMGSVAGLLAATWGRLYSSAFYALRDTSTPLRFALVRVSLSIVFGLLFAFPFRPWINQLFVLTPGLRLPTLEGVDVALGAVGLTLAAGLSGYIEYALLRSRLVRRIGQVKVPTGFLSRIWVSAVAAGALALLFETTVLASLDGHLRWVGYDFAPLCVITVFGVSYLTLCSVFRVEEMKPVLRRLKL